jgi:outer membrane protein OmpA-like peptidoglycan-associated protein
VKETQQASLPTPAELPATAGAATAEPDVRVTFGETETDVPLAQTASLDKLAKDLTAHPGERVNIIAYASGPETSGVFPKRVSLARGIAIRNYLTTTKGIDIERVNVKAQGNKNPGGPGDRVDVFILK